MQDAGASEQLGEQEPQQPSWHRLPAELGFQLMGAASLPSWFHCALMLTRGKTSPWGGLEGSPLIWCSRGDSGSPSPNGEQRLFTCAVSSSSSTHPCTHRDAPGLCPSSGATEPRQTQASWGPWCRGQVSSLEPSLPHPVAGLGREAAGAQPRGWHWLGRRRKRRRKAGEVRGSLWPRRAGTRRLPSGAP